MDEKYLRHETINVKIPIKFQNTHFPRGSSLTMDGKMEIPYAKPLWDYYCDLLKEKKIIRVWNYVGECWDEFVVYGIKLNTDSPVYHTIILDLKEEY